MKLLNQQIITSFFECKRKAFLLLYSTKDYELTEYESIVNTFKINAMEKFLEQNESIDYSIGVLSKESKFIANPRIKFENYYFDCDLLIKERGDSFLGNFYYLPGIFLGTINISRANRMALAFLAFLLEKIQGNYPGTGIAINKKGVLTKIKNTDILKDETTEAIENIVSFNKNEPPIFLNEHCVQCSFKNICRERAIQEDNLSLIDRITAKQIKKLEKKGIFTVRQLSYVYKPRRKNKNSSVLYKPELQALAIRTQKTFVKELPFLEREDVEIFIDVESIPEEHFFYLFGILIVDQGKQKYLSIWSDTKQEEKESWEKAVAILKSYKDAPIYHYGSYESVVFSKLSKKYNTLIQDLKERFININQFIYGKIYFPAYSNRLKELANILGFKWTSKESSGLQSIIWRRHWEQGDKHNKDVILNYNKEDCIALKILTNELTRIQYEAAVSDDIDFVHNSKKISTDIGQNLHNQFTIALELAHKEYGKKKIKVDFKKKEIIKSNEPKKRKSRYEWLGKSLSKPNKTIIYDADRYCFVHRMRQLNKSKIVSRRIKVDLVFNKNGVRKTTIEYIGNHGNCPICNNSYPSLQFRKISRDLYGHNFKAWVVFQRIEIQLSFTKINNSLYGMINDKIGSATGVEFIRQFSEYYEETEKYAIDGLRKSSFIHVDETTVSILGENQYVWVLTSDKYVILKLTKNRETSIVKNILSGYNGVLISDFYAGYDSVDCTQQKCWVHLIRDLNNDLWKNPFDKEYEKFVCEVRNVIIPIIHTTYKHGLNKYFLARHQKNIDKFYKVVIDNKLYKSDLCNTYQKRFKRYKNSLFTFIKHNGVNWHNNEAENRIRHICVQRKISGSFGNNQFPHYLRMVSIMQSCKLQNKSFLKFLISKEINIAKFDPKKI